MKNMSPTLLTLFDKVDPSYAYVIKENDIKDHFTVCNLVNVDSIVVD